MEKYKEIKEYLESIWYIYHPHREKLELCITDNVTLHFDNILGQHYIWVQWRDWWVSYLNIHPDVKSEIAILIKMLSPKK